MADVAELRFADGRQARVPYDVILEGWLGWVAQDWVLDPLTTAALAVSQPDRNEGDVVAGLRAACRSRLGLCDQ